MSAPYANVVRGLAVLKEARRAGQDSATWPRLSPGEARNIITALDDAAELYEALGDVLIHCLADIEAEEQKDEPNEAALTLYRARRDKAQSALAKARGEQVAK